VVIRATGKDCRGARDQVDIDEDERCLALVREPVDKSLPPSRDLVDASCPPTDARALAMALALCFVGRGPEDVVDVMLVVRCLEAYVEL